MSGELGEHTDSTGSGRFGPGLVPILGWLRSYDRRWLRGDLIAGMTVAALIVPKNLGYAEIAGIPVQNGLYAAAAGAILYAIFGTCRQISMGPSSGLAAVAASAVFAAGITDQQEVASFVAGITLASGAVFLVLAVFKLGWIAQFLSRAVVTGFLFGAALDVVIGELPKITGTKVTGSNSLQELFSWLRTLSDTHWLTLLVGVVALAVVFGLRMFIPRVPGALVLVVGGLVASWLLDLGAHDVALVGEVPRGLPRFEVPDGGLLWDHVVIVAMAAFALMLIGFSQTAGDARAFAVKHHYQIDINQESVAQAVANTGAGLFQGMPVSTSLSASSLNDHSGAKTGLACDDLRQRAEANVARMGAAGLRVMAGAFRDLDPTRFDPDGDLLAHIHDLEMTSLVAMVDPPREESKAAVANAQQAHIRVRMVTGDDVVTGASIAKQLGIGGDAILGADFAALSEQERRDRIDSIGVVGRVAPEHKVLLAQTLKDKGDVVAMTGDGVNDAPAIKAADIGVAMGSGTEVAKNAGRMILSDDNFATIVYAVEQGRKLYDNLNKFIRFVLLELVAFVLTFLGATLLNLAAGQPFTPAQILWINFLVNAPFGIALGFDEETPGLMSRRPRPRGESILTKPMMITCGLGGLYVAVANILLILLGKSYYGSVEVGQSIGLVAFSLMLVVAAFESRRERGTVFSVETFNSPRMNKTAVVEIALAYLITQADFLNKLLGTKELTFAQWGLGLLAAVGLLLLWELGKLIARRSRTAAR